MSLAEIFATLLPEGFAVAASDPRAAHPLFPEEAAVVAGAIPRRRAEFAAGRAAARRALAVLGFPEGPIPMAPDRAPVWPAGSIGSISHTRTHCVAVAARENGFRSVGIDIEEDGAVSEELVPTICLPAEQTWLGTQPGDLRRRKASLIFSAKEAVYKCQYRLTGLVIGFEALCIRLDPANATFRAIFQSDTGAIARGTEWQGAYAFGRGLISTAVALRRS